MVVNVYLLFKNFDLRVDAFNYRFVLLTKLVKLSINIIKLVPFSNFFDKLVDKRIMTIV